MEVYREQWISQRTCPYEYDGRNLAWYRRADLRRIAKEWGYDEVAGLHDATKQQLLRGLVVRLERDGGPPV